MKLFFATMILLAGPYALADYSQYYFQPPENGFSAEVSYEGDSNPGKINNGFTDSNYSTNRNDFHFLGMFGLMENLAIGAETLYGSLETDYGNPHTATGMGDIHGFIKGNFSFVHYKFDLGLNTSKTAIDAASSAPDNRSSGGISALAEVGAMFSTRTFNYGADLRYFYPLERDYDDIYASKYTGGSTVRPAVFGEFYFGTGFIGAEFAYIMGSDVTQKRNNYLDVTLKSENYYALKGYFTYDINDLVTGFVDVSMAMHQDHDYSNTNLVATTQKLKAYNETDFNIGARINF